MSERLTALNFTPEQKAEREQFVKLLYEDLGCTGDESVRQGIRRLKSELAAIRERNAELEFQRTFEQAFADKLKEFGTVDRLVEEYSASKMRARGLESQLQAAREALEELVSCNEQWNADVEKIIGRPPNWNDGYLDKARKALDAIKEPASNVGPSQHELIEAIREFARRGYAPAMAYVQRMDAIKEKP